MRSCHEDRSWKGTSRRALDGHHDRIPGPTIPLTYARLFATLERAGQRIGNMDLLIAASAVTAEAPLVTRNMDKFSRIPELELLTY